MRHEHEPQQLDHAMSITEAMDANPEGIVGLRTEFLETILGRIYRDHQGRYTRNESVCYRDDERGVMVKLEDQDFSLMTIARLGLGQVIGRRPRKPTTNTYRTVTAEVVDYQDLQRAREEGEGVSIKQITVAGVGRWFQAEEQKRSITNFPVFSYIEGEEKRDLSVGEVSELLMIISGLTSEQAATDYYFPRDEEKQLIGRAAWYQSRVENIIKNQGGIKGYHNLSLTDDIYDPDERTTASISYSATREGTSIYVALNEPNGLTGMRTVFDYHDFHGYVEKQITEQPSAGYLNKAKEREDFNSLYERHSRVMLDYALYGRSNVASADDLLELFTKLDKMRIEDSF